MSRSRGFTLIEILVVVAILGILATAVTVSLASGARNEAEFEIRRLPLVLELAANQSRWSSRPLAWTWSAEGYRFLRRDDHGDWEILSGDDQLRVRHMPDGVRIAAVESGTQALAPGDPLPFANGQMRPFRITLQMPGGNRYLQGDPSGKVIEVSP